MKQLLVFAPILIGLLVFFIELDATVLVFTLIVSVAAWFGTEYSWPTENDDYIDRRN